MKILDIAEVARESGLAPSRLRHYEDIGLIRPVGRHGLRRQYDPFVLTQLVLIGMGQKAGFRLQEMVNMFALDGTPQLPRDTLRAKASDLEAQIRMLTVLQKMLLHVADCPAPSHLECQSFQKLIRIARHRSRNGRN